MDETNKKKHAQIRGLLKQQPFQPFCLHMTDGQNYEIHKPTMVFLTTSEIVVGLKEWKDGIPDGYRICSLLEVNTVEPLSPATTQAT
jgi:hypothetical protein